MKTRLGGLREDSIHIFPFPKLRFGRINRAMSVTATNKAFPIRPSPTRTFITAKSNNKGIKRTCSFYFYIVLLKDKG